MANVIVKAQDKGVKRKREEAEQQPYGFWITNNMFDESKLWFGKPARSRRCLAWHSQCTWSVDGAQVNDADIVRPPQTLRRYTAAVQWNVIHHDGSDPCGVVPSTDSLPRAKYYGSLTASDSHSVNLLTSKFAAASSPANHFHIASLCVQHKTGSICEEVSKNGGSCPRRSAWLTS